MSIAKTDERADDYFGLCPVCHSAPQWLNVRQSHYNVCHEHRVYWPIGWNLFSSWRTETEADWQRNIDLLRGFRKVEPYFWPETIAEAERSKAELLELKQLEASDKEIEKLFGMNCGDIIQHLDDALASQREDDAAIRGDDKLAFRDCPSPKTPAP
jgi:hypothetical protein